jgi:hypothetical protein
MISTNAMQLLIMVTTFEFMFPRSMLRTAAVIFTLLSLLLTRGDISRRRPILGTLFDAFRKKLSYSLRRPIRGTLLDAFKKKLVPVSSAEMALGHAVRTKRMAVAITAGKPGNVYIV